MERGREGGRGGLREREGGGKHTFRILLRLLRRRICVRILNASRLAVYACVLGMREVEDESGGCGEDYVAGMGCVRVLLLHKGEAIAGFWGGGILGRGFWEKRKGRERERRVGMAVMVLMVLWYLPVFIWDGEDERHFGGCLFNLTLQPCNFSNLGF